MAAYAAACRQSFFDVNRLGTRSITKLVKPDGKGHSLSNNSALVERLEAQGVPSKQVEAVMEVMTELLNDKMERISCSFVSKNEMQKNGMAQESDFSNFRSEVKVSQDQHLALLRHEKEKLKTDIEKMHSEIRSKIDRVADEQGLEFNIERRKIWEAVGRQTQEIVDRSNNLDQENRDMQAKLEAAKLAAIKYSLGTLASACLTGLAAVYIVKSGALPF